MATAFKIWSVVMMAFLKEFFGHQINSDSGLFHGIINSSLVEWNATFMNDYSPDFLMKQVAPLNIWMRCVDDNIRGYFFIENLEKSPTLGLDVCRLEFGGDFRRRFKLMADDKILPYTAWQSGGEFFLNVSDHRSKRNSIQISVDGWLQRINFPFQLCELSQPQPVIPHYIVHMHAPNHLNLKPLSKLIPQAIAMHFKFYRCALNITNYELVIQPDLLQTFLEHPQLRSYFNEGLLTFVLKMYPLPHHIHRGINCFQFIFENTALLRHWGTNVRILFINSDEFLSVDKTVDFSQFKAHLDKSSNVLFQRFNAICSEGCISRQADAANFSLLHKKYEIIGKEEQGKLLIDPNRNGCISCHWSQCGVAESIIPNETAYLIHFPNHFKVRKVGHGAPLDTNRFLMKKCLNF